MKQLCLIILGVLLYVGAFGQYDFNFTQSFFNPQIVNPAYAGSREALSANVFYRNQWVNIEGAPQAFSLGMHGLASDKVGLGFSVENIKVAVINRLSFFTDYSYRVKTGDGYLSLGIKAGIINYRANYQDIETGTGGDIAFGEFVNLWLPNFGWGAYYVADRYYIGLSIPHLIQNKLSENEESNIQKADRLERDYYLTAGYLMDISEGIQLRPSTMIKYGHEGQLEADFGAHFLIKETFWLGASYRTNSSLNFLLQYQFNPQLRVVYAYDISTNIMNPYTSGTHEIMIGFDMNKKDQEHIRVF